MDFLKQLFPNNAHVAIGIISFASALYFGIQKLFKSVDDMLSPEERIELWMWISEARSEPKLKSWTDSPNAVFDRFFGARHVSLRCFLLSCLMSYTMVIVGFIWWLITAKYSFDVATSFRLTLLYAVVGNVLFNYLSLLKTRLFLRWLRSIKRWVGTASLLVLDFGLTGFIGLVAAAFARQLALYNALDPSLNALAASAGGPHGITDIFESALEYSVFYPLFTLKLVLVGALPYLLAAFGPSIWLWLYAGSGLLLRAAVRFDKLIDAVRKWFDVERYPLQVMGWIAAVMCTIAWLVMAPVFVILRSR